MDELVASSSHSPRPEEKVSDDVTTDAVIIISTKAPRKRPAKPAVDSQPAATATGAAAAAVGPQPQARKRPAVSADRKRKPEEVVDDPDDDFITPFTSPKKGAAAAVVAAAAAADKSGLVPATRVRVCCSVVVELCMVRG